MGSSKLVIGSFCSIASGVTIFLGKEHRPDWVSTYPFNVMLKMKRGPWSESLNNLEGHPYTKGDVIIGNDVWIGSGATIISGVSIGDGAVIGARAVIAKSIPPYSVVVGNPGRLIKYRFSEAVISDLLRLKWWDLKDEDINLISPLLQSPNISELIRMLKQLRGIT